MLQYKIFSRHVQNWYNNPTILILNAQPLLPNIYMAGIIIIMFSCNPDNDLKSRRKMDTNFQSRKRNF